MSSIEINNIDHLLLINFTSHALHFNDMKAWLQNKTLILIIPT